MSQAAILNLSSPLSGPPSACQIPQIVMTHTLIWPEISLTKALNIGTNTNLTFTMLRATGVAQRIVSLVTLGDSGRPTLFYIQRLPATGVT